jgi:CheY-like chemotaxis protein
MRLVTDEPIARASAIRHVACSRESEQSMSPSTQPQPPGTNLKRRTVLLVEDHPRQREAIRRWLVEKGFHVEMAADFHRAIRILEIEIPDLFCVNMTLPRESGLELCEHIRNDPRCQFVPILMTGDRGGPEDMANAEEAGANALLKKPFTREKLMQYVVVLLDDPIGDPRSLAPPAVSPPPRKLSA